MGHIAEAYFKLNVVTAGCDESVSQILYIVGIKRPGQDGGEAVRQGRRRRYTPIRYVGRSHRPAVNLYGCRTIWVNVCLALFRGKTKSAYPRLYSGVQVYNEQSKPPALSVNLLTLYPERITAFPPFIPPAHSDKVAFVPRRFRPSTRRNLCIGEVSSAPA